MKIEAGKFYKLRDGSKVGPILDADLFLPRWRVEPRIDTRRVKFDWYEDGEFSSLGCAHPKDIVAEWIDDVSPIRSTTITRNQIVRGTYGNVDIDDDKILTVTGILVDESDDDVDCAIDTLRQTITTLTTIADALEANP